MKKINGLDDKLAHYREDAPEAVRNGMPTFRDHFMDMLGTAQASSGREAIAIYDLGLKVKKANGAGLELEDAEHELLLKLVNGNSMKLFAPYQAQLIIKLERNGLQ